MLAIDHGCGRVGPQYTRYTYINHPPYCSITHRAKAGFRCRRNARNSALLVTDARPHDLASRLTASSQCTKQRRRSPGSSQSPFPRPGRRRRGPSESQLPDRVEQKSAGLQLEYSASTAEWLRRVAEAPHDFALVYNFVSNLLSDSDQPLGALTRRFATLFDSLFLPAHQSSLRKSFSAEALTEKLAGPAASRSRHKSTIASAASSMHLGVNRLHRRCIDVLPPLQCAAASLAAMEAVQAALFELCGPTLPALVGLIVSTEDVALQARPRSNASPRRASSPDLRPLPHQARLSQLSSLASASLRAARAVLARSAAAAAAAHGRCARRQVLGQGLPRGRQGGGAAAIGACVASPCARMPGRAGKHG